MKVTVSASELKKALATAKKAQSKGYVGWSTAVRITTGTDTVTLTATDLDVRASVTIPGTVHAGGAVLVNLAELAATSKGRGELALVTEDGKLTVHGATVSTLPTYDLSEFPKDAEDVPGPTYTVDLSTVAEVCSAASTDQYRPILTGVLFDGLDITATDSYRLHTVSVPDAHFPTTLIPSRLFRAAGKVGQAELAIGTDTVRLTVGNVVWHARTVYGEFPNWKQLVPASGPDDSTVTTNRASFRALLEAIEPGKKSAVPVPVRLVTSDLTITASVIEQDVADRSGAVSVSGRTGRGVDLVAFNPVFLIAALDAGRDSDVTLTMRDSLKPALITEHRSDGTTSRQLLMPVRVS